MTTQVQTVELSEDEAKALECVFKRHEMKYLLTDEDREQFEREMAGHMVPDAYGDSHISSIYFDTPTGLIARLSIEGNAYKEKLRVRSYGVTNPDTTVFVEIKKKVNGITYKRRVPARADIAMERLCAGSFPGDDQISREINWLVRHYEGLAPSILVTYNRCAYYACDDADFRLTLDRNVRWIDRSDPVEENPAGGELLGPDRTILEIKTGTAVPMWVIDFLERREIRQTSFSKFERSFVSREMLRLEAGEGQTGTLPVSAKVESVGAANAERHAAGKSPAHMKNPNERTISYA